MATKIFVGKLSFDTTEKTLNELFSQYGQVTSVAVLTDQVTKKSRGFGFVEMANLKEAQTAIKELDGKELDGRQIIVNAARERTDTNNTRRSSGYQRSW